MKKIFALMLIFSVASASAAFALTVTNQTGDVAVGTLTIKTSKNVYFYYKSALDNTGYSVSTYHNKGTKSFGSSSGDAKIYEFAETAKDCPTAPVGTASADFTGWSSL